MIAYLWQWLHGTGMERCRIWRDPLGWRLAGTVVTLSGSQPAEARYRIECDPGWRTQRVTVTLDLDGAERTVEIAVAHGSWRIDGKDAVAVRGCVDIDLGWSPSTNTLPIRRLDLRVGASSGTLTTAWLRFPELTLEPMLQRYQRLAERQYRYTSRAGKFTALLDVDKDGVVQEYEGHWKRIGP